MYKPIDLSQQETWPEQIVAELEANLSILCAHEENRRRIDEICKENVLARVNPPALCHSRMISLLLERINSCLNDHCLVGFHCTRLHESEIEIVKEQGLRPLSEELAYKRVRCLQGIGVIPSHVALKLLSENAVNNRHGKRLGRLCFIFSRSSLRDEHGVSLLLSYWGGEALYWVHKNDPEIASVLKMIGRPCIIQVTVPISILNTFQSVGEKLVSVFLRTRGGETTDNGTLKGFEGSLDQALAVEHIHRVIKYGEPEFETLTDYTKWRSCLS